MSFILVLHLLFYFSSTRERESTESFQFPATKESWRSLGINIGIPQEIISVTGNGWSLYTAAVWLITEYAFQKDSEYFGTDLFLFRMGCSWRRRNMTKEDEWWRVREGWRMWWMDRRLKDKGWRTKVRWWMKGRWRMKDEGDWCILESLIERSPFALKISTCASV